MEESPQAWSKCPPSQKVIKKQAVIISPKIIFNQTKMPHLWFWSIQAFPSLLPCNQGWEQELTRGVTPSFHTPHFQTEDLPLPVDPDEALEAHLLIEWSYFFHWRALCSSWRISWDMVFLSSTTDPFLGPKVISSPSRDKSNLQFGALQHR